MKIYLGISFALFVLACKTPQQQGAGDCRLKGEVKDMTGLDGCGLMIVMEDGSRLQPVEVADSSFRLQAGQKIQFNYTELKDRMSSCMAGKIVRIDCIKAQ